MKHGIVVLVFRCKITGGSLTTTDETADYRWVSQQEIYELASEAFGVRVLDALDPSTRPVVRQHDGEHIL
jgi:8-oxo-dGTP diphosphatase